jgi:hypothetical protein
MPGPNYVLDKGFICTGSTAYAFGEVLVQGSTNTSCARASATNQLALGVAQEIIDVGKVTTGKATINVRLLGITRVIASAAISRGARVGTTATARAVAVTKAATGVQLAESFGIALSPASANGDMIDVLLTPGGQF